MSIIKTANYLIGVEATATSGKTLSPFQLKYENVDEFLANEPTTKTSPNGWDITNYAFGDRNTYPNGIRHIFLHHSATLQSKGNKGMIDVFNARSFKGGYASSHRGIDAEGNVEVIVPDEKRAYCQGVKGMSKYAACPNYTGMSVELIALGYVKDTPKNDRLYYQGSYGLPENETALSVDFNEQPKAFRGHSRWNRYTQKQVDATVALIREWGNKHKIPFVFNQAAFDIMFPPKSKLNDTWRRTISDAKGVYSHNTVKEGKSDIYPDPILIKTFKKEFAPGNSLDPTNLK
jgi:N-acetyl-anhydromuramyl-L-alanine amidase AmpD